MPSCGVLYIVWGEDGERFLKRSTSSLEASNPGLTYRVVRLTVGTLLDKARMGELSPFDLTVFLDADTVVLGDLEFGFAAARRHGMACRICECPWAARYGGWWKAEGKGKALPAKGGTTNAVVRDAGDFEDDPVFDSIARCGLEYNTGVLFWDGNSPAACRVLESWRELAGTMDSSIRWRPVGQTEEKVMAENDQGSFAKACWLEEYQPFILPAQWNFRPRWDWAWFGKVIVWHDWDDPSEGFLKHNRMAGPMDFATVKSVIGRHKEAQEGIVAKGLSDVG